ncbi:MAG TPA: hypothetical protein PLH25_09660 [Flavobacterium sp.]|jgi:hypothetical protein|nr:hypothetical protein [Flavobacterium sp.]HQW69922.1 hypothetical protein [Flavobacterium sp.]
MIHRKIKIGLFIIAGIFLAISAYLFIFFISATDTKNIKIVGCIEDKQTGQPISNAKIVIENFRYESDKGYSNYDEYLGTDKFELTSDEKGYYSIEVDKSAFVVVEVKKDGYKNKTESEYASKTMKFNVNLEKVDH